MLNESIQDELNGRTVEDLLDSLSLDIMRDTIHQQIYGELNSNRDFMSVVLSKFQFICENGDFDDETKQVIRNQIADFYNTIIGYIVSNFDLAYNECPGEEQEIAEVLYQFFILKRVSNIKKFIIGYVEENKESIITGLGIEKGTDVMSLAMSHKVDNPNDVKIIANLDAVINHIVSLGLSAEEFLDVLGSDGEYYAQKLLELVDEDTINGNFVSDYIGGIIEDYDNENYTTIRNDIRIHFIKCDI